MTITLINVIVKITTLINIIVKTIIDILSTSFCLGLGDGWGMKPSLGRPEVNKCKMQSSIANLKWYFCYVVASIITLFTFWNQLMFQMLKPGELGSHLLQTLDGFIFVLSRCSKITIVIIHTSLIITRKIMEKLLMGHYSTNFTLSRSSMCKLLTYYYISAMGRSCTSARQLVSTLVWVRWSTTLYFKWNQKVRNFIQWIPSERHGSCSPNLELQKKFNLPKVELTGNSIYEYIHPLDHEEIGHLLTVQPLHYSQGHTLSLFSLFPNYFFC